MQATTTCPEDITAATLAAWRDGALSAADAERIAAHAPDCPACSDELDTYDSLEAALRRMAAPEPDGRLWEAVRAGMHGAGRRRRPVRGRAPQLTGGLGAVAAVVLLALGFAQVLHYRVAPTVRTSATATTAPHGTPTPLPTAVPPAPAVDGPHPNWQQARLPLEPLTDQDILTYAVVPGHGESAYACHAISDNSGATLTFYRTNDRAQHWTSLTQLMDPQIDVAACMVQIDALDGNRVLIEGHGQNMQTLKEFTGSMLSEDGGATWTRLDEGVTTYELATLKDKTYALRERAIGQLSYVQNLSVSVDHLHTWQPIDQALVGPNTSVSNFWLNPSGELLAEVTTVRNAATPTATANPGLPRVRPSLDVALWHSTDGGAHWDPFPAPMLSSTQQMLHFIVEQPVAGQLWQICASYQLKGSTSSASLVCTFDSGRTWSARPQLCVAAPCQAGAICSIDCTLASDGAVFSTAEEPGTPGQLGLYRLPRGSTTWQYLGALADSSTYFFAPTSTGGMLWAYAGATSLGHLSGIIGGHQALPGVLSTATYP